MNKYHYCCLYLRITWPIAQISVTSFSIDQFHTAACCCYGEESRHFYVPRPSFFVCPGDAPVAIMQNIAWMKRQFSACQTPRCMYLSIFNSFRVILGTCEASRFDSNSNRTSRFDSIWEWRADSKISNRCACHVCRRTINNTHYSTTNFNRFPSYHKQHSLFNDKFQSFRHCYWDLYWV